MWCNNLWKCEWKDVAGPASPFEVSSLMQRVTVNDCHPRGAHPMPCSQRDFTGVQPRTELARPRWPPGLQATASEKRSGVLLEVSEITSEKRDSDQLEQRHSSTCSMMEGGGGVGPLIFWLHDWYVISICLHLCYGCGRVFKYFSLDTLHMLRHFSYFVFLLTHNCKCRYLIYLKQENMTIVQQDQSEASLWLVLTQDFLHINKRYPVTFGDSCTRNASKYRTVLQFSLFCFSSLFRSCCNY